MELDVRFEVAGSDVTPSRYRDRGHEEGVRATARRELAIRMTAAHSYWADGGIQAGTACATPNYQSTDYAIEPRTSRALALKRGRARRGQYVQCSL